MDVGIDLGTTFSVVAVKGRVDLVDGFPMYLEECDVTLIPTPEGDYTFPSAFWVDPDSPDSMLVGITAKQKADEGMAPIMFSKRSIGTNEPLRMNDRTFTAKEVATHILKHMKECAELALGQPITRAVITHPAYFEPSQVQETREAAIAAGFDMSLPEQMMMEPAAAALAYIQGETKDPLRVMTYDLGGGTFDVTVLERSAGTITMKAFDGDHLLGGYTFDREMVQWILNRIADSGRVIPYDKDNPEDRGRRARLLQLAEGIKLRLYEQPSAKAFVPVKVSDILVDDKGVKVQFIDRINREMYSELIKDHVANTIACCHRALAKADMQLEDLDAILLVGGSTYGQWVVDAVSAAFSINVEPYNPDLCVAAGAAIQAATLPPIASGSGVRIVADIPASSAIPIINISGHVRSDDGDDLEDSVRSELMVLLTTPDGTTLDPCPLDDHGSFLFTGLDLLEDEPSSFTIRITDSKGLERLSQVYEVKYSPDEGGVIDINTVLPKPLYLRTAEGMKELAEEGVPLPAKCEVALKRLHSDKSVDIEVFMQDTHVGTVRIDNVPEDAGAGSRVVLTVEITQKNEMRGTAKVLSHTGVVAAQCPVRISFPPLALPTLNELQAGYEELKARREQEEILCDDPERRLLLAGVGKKIDNQLRKLFTEQEPDKQEINRALRELDKIVNPPPDDMDPPRTVFRALVEECDRLLAAQGTDPAMQTWRNSLQKLESDGNDAFTTKNQKKWSITIDNLKRLHDKLSPKSEQGGEQDLPPTPYIKDSFKQEVEKHRSSLRAVRMEAETLPDYEAKLKARCDSVATLLDQVEAAIDKVSDSLEPRQGLAQCQLATRPLADMAKRIQTITIEVGGPSGG